MQTKQRTLGGLRVIKDVPEKITVDWLLDNVDLTFQGYSPSIVAIEFFNFIRLTLGEEPENENSLAHYFLVDVIFMQDTVRDYLVLRGIDYDSVKGRTAVLCCREFAKALTLDTKVATPNGWTTMKDVQVGDYVISRKGTPTKVTHKSKLFFNETHNTYKMVTEDGREFKLSRDHLNIVLERDRGRKPNGKMKELVLTTEELQLNGIHINRTITDKQRKGYENKYYIPMMDKPIEFNKITCPIDPYVVGLLLGDGSIDKATGYPRITAHEDDWLEYKKHIPYEIGSEYIKQGQGHIVFAGIKGISKQVKNFIGLESVYDKKIPEDLFIGSVDQRLSLLQGLMDTDGTINKKGSMSFTSASYELAKGVQRLVWDLGGVSKIVEKSTNSKFGKAWQVSIGLNLPVFRLPRKLERYQYNFARTYVGIKSLEIIHTQPMKCISVEDESESYIIDQGLVTHNSTIIGSFVPLYIAWKGELPGYGKVNYGLYIGDSMRNNVKTTMNTIEQVYLESVWLQTQFESARFTDELVELVRLPRTATEISLYEVAMAAGKKPTQVPGRSKRKFAMRGVGAQTGVRGTRSGLQRPQFAIIDDVVPSEAEANSDTILSSIDSTIESDVLNALHGAGSFAILIGTPYNKKDPVYSRVESGAWVPVVFPICESIHEDMELHEFRGVWENRHSYTKVMKRYKDALNSNKTRSFMQELMLRITSEKDKVIPNDYIEWFNREDILKNGASYNWYITTDFTTTGGASNDFSGIAIWAVSSNNDYLLVDLVLKKMDIALQYNELFRLVNKYKRFNGTVEVGIEIDGQQKLHLFAIKELMNKRNEYFTIARQKGGVREGILSKQGKGGKEGRFSVMVPLFQAGKIRFARDLNDSSSMRELKNELDYITYDEYGRVQFGSVHDDGIDLISQLALMNIFSPSDVINPSYKEQDPMWYDDEPKQSILSSYIV